MRPISTRLRRCLHAGIAGVLVAATSDCAFPETYPVTTIRLIVPAAPGSTADIATRCPRRRTLLTPAAFAQLTADDLARWLPVVKAVRGKAD